MRRRDLALLALGGAHLAFATNAALGLVDPRGPAAPLLGLYGNATGAEMGFAFFAPDVPSEVSPRVRLFDAEGRALPPLPAPSREERFREECASLYFLQRGSPGLVAAALAADALTREPAAARAVVAIRVHRVPTMAETRRGARPVDETRYEGEFVRNVGP